MNERTQLSKSDYWRQLDIFNPNNHKNQSIHIIGAGSIGSATALCLAKVGLGKITVWDSDKVEPHNLPNQLYQIKSLKQPKVQALKTLIKDMTDFTITPKQQMFQSTKAPVWTNTIVIAATDSMESRADIWSTVKLKPNVRLYIDARMGGQLMRIFTVNPMSKKHIDQYEKSLYTDEKAADIPCSEKSISYNIFGIASLIVNQIKKALKQEEYYNEIIFDYQTMLMEKIDWTGDLI